MPKHEFSIVIKRPVSDVFDFVENPVNDPIWRTGMTEADVESTGPVTVGTTGHEVYRYLGRDIETTWEIIEFTTNEQVAYRSTSGPVNYEGSMSYEPEDGGTRITWRLEWEIADQSVFPRLREQTFKLVDERVYQRDFLTLKRLLEA